MISHQHPEFPSDITIETIAPFDEEAIEIIEQFIELEQEAKRADLAVLPTLEEKKARSAHGMMLSQVKLVIKQIKERGNPENSFMCVAKEGDQMVGFSLVGLNLNWESVGAFTGVKWAYKNRGIATSLTKRRVEELKKRNVQQFNLELWEGSLAVAKKLEDEGLIDIIPEQDDPKSFVIKIRRQH